ncbi:hypothetical protein H6F75_00290 [Nodosilinea sp. FACHB-131]|uniref:hypothetical protein n=1 Tax=Cyanophyceae TaxID=3028117 RepID=UPI001689A057|nr:hypothetical protein [Nodosilinea sp. FACHB-131]MBD1871908.1 hypothetical protein [Nodosilinea sp. FACHB-131]
MSTWAISQFEHDEYYGEFATKEDAIAEGNAAGYEGFWVGQRREPSPLSDGVFAADLIESALETLEDEWGLECASFEPTAAQLKTLEEEVRIVVDRWFDQYNLHPKWFIVDNPEAIPPF